MSNHVHPPGTKVSIHGHAEWPDGTTGTVANWPKEVRNLTGEQWEEGQPRTLVTPKGVSLTYWVWFDEPTDDGSGDGPYKGGEVDGKYLHATEPGSSGP